MNNRSSPVRSIFERNRGRMKYLEKIYYGQNSDCVNLLRTNEDVLFNLCTKYHSMNALRDTWQLAVEEQVAKSLQTVGHKKHNWDIKVSFYKVS